MTAPSRRIAEALHRVVLGVAGSLMVAVFVVAALGVIFRYGLAHSLPWADETAAYLFIWLVFLGAAAEVWGGGHPAMHFVEDRLPPRLRRASFVLAQLVIALWGAILVIWGTRAVLLEAPESMSSLPAVSLQLPYSAIPVAGALVVIFALCRLADRR